LDRRAGDSLDAACVDFRRDCGRGSTATTTTNVEDETRTRADAADDVNVDGAFTIQRSSASHFQQTCPSPAVPLNRERALWLVAAAAKWVASFGAHRTNVNVTLFPSDVSVAGQRFPSTRPSHARTHPRGCSDCGGRDE